MKKFFLYGSLMLLTFPALQAQSGNNRNVRYMENLTAQLTQVVRNVQDENARLEMKVSELQRQMKELAAKNKEMEQEMQRLKRQSAAEAEAREAQLREISKQIKRLASLPPPAPVHSGRKSDSGSTHQNYEIFEVPKGATLSAIAKAYNVSVQSIKRANNMKDNNLRVGQKLKIPVK
jgi:LysM repeat protein